MTNSKDYSKIGRTRHYKALALKAFGSLAAIYSVGGLVIDSIPFPGVALFHSPEIQNNTERFISPSGNTQFKPLDLHRDVTGVSDTELKTAQDLAGSDGIIDKDEIKSACNALTGKNDQIDSMNVMLTDIKNKRIAGVKLSSWNVKGCSQEVNK